MVTKVKIEDFIQTQPSPIDFSRIQPGQVSIGDPRPLPPELRRIERDPPEIDIPDRPELPTAPSPIDFARDVISRPAPEPTPIDFSPIPTRPPIDVSPTPTPTPTPEIRQKIGFAPVPEALTEVVERRRVRPTPRPEPTPVPDVRETRVDLAPPRVDIDPTPRDVRPTVGLYAPEELPKDPEIEPTKRERRERRLDLIRDPFGTMIGLRDRDKQLEGIQKIRAKIHDRLLTSPEMRELQDEFNQLEKSIDQTDKRLEDHNKRVENYEKKVEEFNKKYSGELPPEEYQKAVKEQDNLEQQAEQINTQSEILNQIREEEISALEDLGEREKAQQRKEKRDPRRVRTGILLGLAETPLFALEASVDPERAILDMAKGIIELPKALVQDPFLTTGMLVGTGAGFYGATATLTRAGRVAQASKARTGRPHRTQFSQSVSDAKQIGKNTYEVKAKTTAKVYDTKTNKLIDTISSDVATEIVTARTKSGAIRTALDSYAASIGKKGQRITTEPTKVTQKYDLARAKGELRFEITDPTKIKGAGIIDIMDIGKLRLKGTPGEIVIDPIFKRKAPRDVAVVDPVIAKILTDKVPAKRPIKPGVDLLGFEQYFKAQALVETRPTKIRVKGFTRKDGTRIRAHLRRVDKRTKPKELAFDEQLGKVFQYDPETPIGITFEPIPITVPKPPRVPKRPPKPPKDPVQLFLKELKRERPRDVVESKGFQKQVLRTELDQVAAQTAARVAQEKIVRTQVTKRMKARETRAQQRAQTKARQQQAGLQKLTQGVTTAITPAVAVREAQISRERQRQMAQQRTRESLALSQTITPLLSQTAAQAVAQRTAQTTATQLRQITTTDLVEPITTTITPTQLTPPIPPTTPKPPRIPRIIRLKTPTQIEKEMKKPHHVFILEKGRWKKATKKPLTRRRAKDKMAYIVDETLSARGKIKKAKGKTKEPRIDVPQDYFKIQRYKFRDFKVKKGKRKPLKNEWIERAQYRLDSPREVAGITKARFLSERRKKTKEVKRVDKGMKDIFGF